jgi:signal transduction histidine kinase
MRLLPKSLFGQLVLLLIGGLLVTQAVTTGILLQDRGAVILQGIRGNIANRTTAIVRLLNSAAPAQRKKLITALNSPELRVYLRSQPSIPPTSDSGSMMGAIIGRTIARQLQQQLAATPSIRVVVEKARMYVPSPRDHRSMMAGRGEMNHATMRAMMGSGSHGATMVEAVQIEVRLKDGSWLALIRPIPDRLTGWPDRLLLILAILLLGILLISFFTVRRITRPLRTLSRAADELGRDINRKPLAESGPSEVGEAARAFNRMQQRLARYLNDRTRILTAISHDLKTPITRLRLRSELLGEGEPKEKFQRDLDDMESMVTATLDFMRGSADREKAQPIDMLALLESLREDAIESGAKVDLEGQPLAPFPGRPLALKRCLGNLIDNAVRYGGEAHIRIADSAEQLVITISDRGPGIPAAAMDEMFEPFSRLESSRAADTGGTGLGLGIARNIARGHGGDIHLRNRPEGGLQAELRLPR